MNSFEALEHEIATYERFAPRSYDRILIDTVDFDDLIDTEKFINSVKNHTTNMIIHINTGAEYR